MRKALLLLSRWCLCCAVFAAILVAAAKQQQQQKKDNGSGGPRHGSKSQHHSSLRLGKKQQDDNNNKQRLLGWKFAGPTTYLNAFDDDASLASAGAVQDIVRGNDGSWFIGSVNGGVWRTESLALEHDDERNPVAPHWTNVLDGQPSINCASISALAVGSERRLYAGCGGSTSSEQGSDWNVVNSGDWGGIMVSESDGDSWKMLPGFPPNYYVTDILEFSATTTTTGVGTTTAAAAAAATTTTTTSSSNGTTTTADDATKTTTTTTVLLVAAQSHLYDRNDGGIWKSVDGGDTFRRVDDTPTFTLTKLPVGGGDGIGIQILATHARNPNRSVSLSSDNGDSFRDLGPLPWKAGAVPFYTCSAVLGDGRLVVAGLTRLPGGFPNNTDSQFFITRESFFSSDEVVTTAAAAPVSSSSTRGNNNNIYKDNNSNNKSGASSSSSPRWARFYQPSRMDEDSMPKDRMALLADPGLPDTMYVAGNAGALAWRVNATSSEWTQLWDEPSVADGSVPHGDCRNYAWDPVGQQLLLVSDGGVFAREQPRKNGGRWMSLNGDYSSLELLSAHYDPNGGRFVAGAQDNCAIVTRPGSAPSDAGYCFVEGDGAVTLVDSSVNPSRLFGTTQFLGIGTVNIDPTTKKKKKKKTIAGDGDDDDDEGCGGLCYAQGDRFVEVPVQKYFPEPSSFPFFVHPYTLNSQDPTRLIFWTNGTTTGPRPSAFYEFSLPYSVRNKNDIGAPKKVLETPGGVMILDFVSGGYTAGRPDPDLLLAISSTHLYVRSSDSKLPGEEQPRSNDDDNRKTPQQPQQLVQRPLPVEFAVPVGLRYDEKNNGARILGPLTHARTVFMAVAPSDSRFVAVTGWSTIESNLGDESVFLTTDAGTTWKNITGNLRKASGVVGKVRPGGMEIVDLTTTTTDDYDDTTTRALLVGTSNGILVTKVVSSSRRKETTTTTKKSPRKDPLEEEERQEWRRFGMREEFPLVLTADVDHEPRSDKLVAATFGRGIYVLDNAKETLLAVLLRDSSTKRTNTTAATALE